VFRDCGHYLHQERPAEFVAALRAFLDTVTSPNTTALRQAPRTRAWSEPVRGLFDSALNALRSRSNN
jgi:hypothetical protein